MPREVGTRAIIVCDESAAGDRIAARVVDTLGSQAINALVFDETRNDELSTLAGKLIKFAEDTHAQFVVGVGDTPALNIARLGAHLMSSDVSVNRLLDEGGFAGALPSRRGAPLILLPAAWWDPYALSTWSAVVDARDRSPVLLRDLARPTILSMEDETVFGLSKVEQGYRFLSALMDCAEAFTADRVSGVLQPLLERTLGQLMELVGKAAGGGELPPSADVLDVLVEAAVAVSQSRPGVGRALCFAIHARTGVPAHHLIPSVLPEIISAIARTGTAGARTLAGALGAEESGELIDDVRTSLGRMDVPLRLGELGLRRQELTGVPADVERMVRGSSRIGSDADEMSQLVDRIF
jgi:alcohol dehydrogenase class IV